MCGQGALDFGPSGLKPVQRVGVEFQNHPALGAEQKALSVSELSITVAL